MFKKLIAKRTEKLRSRLLDDILVRKAGKAGAKLTKKCRRTFATWLLSGDKEPFQIESDVEHSISITRRDLRRVLGRLKRQIEGDIASGMQAVVQAGSRALRPEYNRTWPAELRRQTREANGFRKRLLERYRKPLGLLGMMRTLAIELGNEINVDLRKKPARGARVAMVEATTRLHARICQITCEIETLLSAGYADGAMARWRSLHETSVTLQFIVHHGSGTAVRFLDHEQIGAVFAAEKYNEVASFLGEDPYTAEELAAMKQAAQAMIGLHGQPFAGENGWAAKDLGFAQNRKIHFGFLEKAVGLAHFHPYYKWASQYVHAGPKSLLNRLSAPNSPERLLTGASNVGLTDPAQNTALSFAQSTVALVTLASSIDRVCFGRVLGDLAKEVGEEFWKVEQEIAAEEKQKAVVEN